MSCCRRKAAIPVAYVAGSLAAPSPGQRIDNIERAWRTGQWLVGLGVSPVVPHLLSRDPSWVERPEEWWRESTLETLRRCDVVVLVWGDSTRETSVGTQGEIAEAQRLGLDVLELEQVPGWLAARETAPCEGCHCAEALTREHLAGSE